MHLTSAKWGKIQTLPDTHMPTLSYSKIIFSLAQEYKTATSLNPSFLYAAILTLRVNRVHEHDSKLYYQWRRFRYEHRPRWNSGVSEVWTVDIRTINLPRAIHAPFWILKRAGFEPELMIQTTAPQVGSSHVYGRVRKYPSLMISDTHTLWSCCLLVLVDFHSRHTRIILSGWVYNHLQAKIPGIIVWMR